jgi:hypothetical protein
LSWTWTFMVSKTFVMAKMHWMTIQLTKTGFTSWVGLMWPDKQQGVSCCKIWLVEWLSW